MIRFAGYPRRAVLAWVPFLALALALFVAQALCAACDAHTAESPGAMVFKDDLGHTVTLAHPPRRVITMLPSLTEMVCAIGACDRLVATDRYSNWPVQVAALPKAGGLDDAQIETIVGLAPDLVLLSRSARLAGRLHELGINEFAFDTDAYADIARNIAALGEIFGLRENAAALAQRIASDVQRIGDEAHARRHGAGPTVYFEVDAAPYAAGTTSFIGELLQRLGARNIVPAKLGPFPKLNPEYIVRQNPDIIISSPAESPRLVERPGWNEIRAVREHRLCSFPTEVRDIVYRPGPRVAESMRLIEDCLERVAP